MAEQQKKTPKRRPLGTKDYLYNVDTSLYISDAALDAIYALEGHDKGAEMVDTLTTYYGITKNGLAQLKELRDNYFVNVPKELLNASVKSLTRDQAREVTKYIAVHNSLRINDHFGDNDTFLNLPLHVRSAVLTDYHTGGVPSIADSWKDPEKKGSIMKAFETGSREKIALALISDSYGNVMQYKDDEQNGKRNRHLAAVRLMYDTENNSFPNKKAADALKAKWQNQPGTIDSVANTLRRLDDYFTTQYEQEESARVNAYYGGKDKSELEPIQKSQEEMDKITQPPTQKDDIRDRLERFTSDFTNAVKKLFTNKQEDDNASTRNQDINMQ